MIFFSSTHLRKSVALIFSLGFILCFDASAQMRKVFHDPDEPGNEIYKISFYSPSEGYVAFRDWIGFSSDSGHTFQKKPITLTNVDFNGYGINLTFGFYINGIHAFDRNKLVAYGHYGLVPSILYSDNGGSSFKVVFHSQKDPMQLRTGITDMIFPGNGQDGFATDADRILKTTNGGASWTVLRTDNGAYWTNLEAVDKNTIYAFSTEFATNRLIRTTNGGSFWTQMVLPALPGVKLTYVHFRTASKGWVSVFDNNNRGYFYSTTNGGGSWTLQNNLSVTPFNCTKMKFTDDSTGFALSEQNTVFKTLSGGRIWEPLKRDNNFVYLGYTHNDLSFVNQNQFWAGGGHGLLEISTNAGGTPLPRAFFKVDTSGVGIGSGVKLQNFSRNDHQFEWYLNGELISTSYNHTYQHNIFRTVDTVKLVVTNSMGRIHQHGSLNFTRL